jgi:dTDP-4-amino-4,6-dideoxygalactose transaminase
VIVDKEKYGMDRDELLRKLNDNHIQTRPLWGLIHKQKPYMENQAYKIEKAYYYEKNLINVPCSSNLADEDVEIVVERLRIYKNRVVR